MNQPPTTISMKRLKELAMEPGGVGLVGVTCAVCGTGYICAETIAAAASVLNGKALCACPRCYTRTAGALFNREKKE